MTRLLPPTRNLPSNSISTTGIGGLLSSDGLCGNPFGSYVPDRRRPKTVGLAAAFIDGGPVPGSALPDAYLVEGFFAGFFGTGAFARFVRSIPMTRISSTPGWAEATDSQ